MAALQHLSINDSVDRSTTFQVTLSTNGMKILLSKKYNKKYQFVYNIKNCI
jgi:hypothetical protein